jgi:thiol-disulfide isomerase/thioredoxin
MLGGASRERCVPYSFPLIFMNLFTSKRKYISFVYMFRMNMKKIILAGWYLIAFLFIASTIALAPDNPKTLPIGSKAPNFNLKGIDGKMYTLASFKDAKILVIVFTCNHCPTAQAYEERVKKLTDDYADKGVKVIAIMPNSASALRYDELGWSDEPDDYEGMIRRAKDKQFNFPYLYDGDTEEVSLKYGPVSTPHVFIFDKDRILRYTGRVDDEENFRKPIHVQDTRNALDALLSNKPVAVETTKVFGCSIKWKTKSDWIDNANTTWAKQPVSLQNITADSIKTLLKNKGGDKLRLINIWATWCGPCVAEFPEFVKLSRIYRERDFEFISISADDSVNTDKALRFLKKQESSGANYLFTGVNKYSLIEAVDPNWQGALPYTILVEPGGNIVYSGEGSVDPEELRRLIFKNKYIGRLFK